MQQLVLALALCAGWLALPVGVIGAFISHDNIPTNPDRSIAHAWAEAMYRRRMRNFIALAVIGALAIIVIGFYASLNDIDVKFPV